jgi:predicted restriction endonuclease
MPRRWPREELLLAMSLYCRLPFGKFHQHNPEVIRLAEAIGRTPSAVAMKLCNLASLDPYHQERDVKGLGNASNLDREIWAEFHADWEKLAEESGLLLERYQLPTDIEQPAPPDEDRETETQRTVKVRLVQQFFRDAVLASYDTRCCVTGISLKSLLVASHILPWSTHPEHRINPANGLCLNALHDKAFDRGFITLDEDLRLVLSTELHDATSNKVLKESFLPFEGQSIQLPEKFRPAGEFLEFHREEVFRG